MRALFLLACLTFLTTVTVDAERVSGEPITVKAHYDDFLMAIDCDGTGDLNCIFIHHGYRI